MQQGPEERPRLRPLFLPLSPGKVVAPFQEFGCPCREKRHSENERGWSANTLKWFVVRERITDGNLASRDEHMNDEDLLEAFHRGDEGAFGALYTRWRPRVHRFLFALGARGEDVDDVAQT